MISKVDFQNHWTTKSRAFFPAYLLGKIRAKLGDNGIAGLVNYDDRRYEACAERADSRIGIRDIGNALYSEYHNSMLIRGEEVRTQDGDLLIMGTKKGKHPAHKRTLDDTMKEAIDENGIVIITTPFFRSNVGQRIQQNPGLWKYVHAVEVHNGNVPRERNLQAKELYHLGKTENPSIGLLSSSDGHSFMEVGTSYTRMPLPKLDELQTPEQVVEALKLAISRTDNSDLEEVRNYIQPIIHAGIIVSMVQLDKRLPKGLKRIPGISHILNRGDQEALLS